MNRSKLIFLVIILSLLSILAYAIHQYKTRDIIGGGTIFAGSLILSYLINHITWGDPNGVSKERQNEIG